LEHSKKDGGFVFPLTTSTTQALPIWRLFLGMIIGALCSTWSAQMPQNIQALHGSCVLIPCTFQIPSDYDQYLKDPVGMWKTGYRHSQNIVFSSKETLKNDIQGEMIGNLSEKNCTTVLYNITKDRTDHYFLKTEGIGKLKDMVKEGDSVTLREGDSVTLTCSAPASCPSLPPTLSWTIRLSDSVTVFQENDDQTKPVSSVMTFTASHVLHKQEVKCTAVYRLQADNSERTSHTNVTLKVLYSPKNTLVLIGKDGSLTCSSDANPAVNNFTWYKVTGSEIEVVSYTQTLTCNITEVSGQYYCQAQNEHGLQNSSTVQLHCESQTPGSAQQGPPVVRKAQQGLLVVSRAKPGPPAISRAKPGPPAISRAKPGPPAISRAKPGPPVRNC
uniref:Ig-like domain-containing protein n=1 Tax=Paramormyrops kingsleyae TaxID=1676925 RepID=A0A3B3RV29_9TELE